MIAQQTAPPRRRRSDPLGPAWLLVAALVWAAHGFGGALSRDAALYVYAGQEIVAGHVPYDAVMNRAGPLAQLLPALGVWLGRTAGLEDVIGVRVVFLLVVVAVPALVYVLSRGATGSRVAGCVAAAAALAFEGFAVAATTGPQSKQPMVVLLVVALLLMQRRRMLLAGVATALAVLTWQPVLFAAAPAALVVGWWGYAGLRARLAAYLRYGAGGLLTLGVATGALAAVGGVPAFVEGYWTANTSATVQPGILDRPEQAWEMVAGWYGWTTWLLVVGAALALVGWLLPRPGRRPDGERDPMPAALAAATAGGTGWSLYAFNGAPDAFMLLPLAACGLGSAAALLLALARPPALRRGVGVVLAAAAVAAVAVTTHLTVTTTSTALAEETEAADALFTALPDDATVLAAEAPQPLALTGHRSITRYVLYGAGMTSYIDLTWPGGLTGYRDWLVEQEPTVVLAPTGGIQGFLRPMLREYDAVGTGPEWEVWLRQDTDDATHERVAAALAG